MRNSGWYIPFWRRPRKKGKADRPSHEEVTRTDEQLEAVRQRWIERYRRTVRALTLMGLSVGSNRSEVQARYEQLRQGGSVPQRDLEEAYRFLMRVLPPQERRKRRSQAAGAPRTRLEGEGERVADGQTAAVAEASMQEPIEHEHNGHDDTDGDADTYDEEEDEIYDEEDEA